MSWERESVPSTSNRNPSDVAILMSVEGPTAAAAEREEETGGGRRERVNLFACADHNANENLRSNAEEESSMKKRKETKKKER